MIVGFPLRLRTLRIHEVVYYILVLHFPINKCFSILQIKHKPLWTTTVTQNNFSLCSILSFLITTKFWFHVSSNEYFFLTMEHFSSGSTCNLVFPCLSHKNISYVTTNLISLNLQEKELIFKAASWMFVGVTLENVLILCFHWLRRAHLRNGGSQILVYHPMSELIKMPLNIAHKYTRLTIEDASSNSNYHELV